MADAGDLKSLAFGRVGSSPTLGIPPIEAALTVLAAIGVMAVAWRSVCAFARLVRRELDRFLAREAADARASRGDLTGMADAESRAAEARRARRRVLFELGFWLALLLVPLWTPWTTPLYAGCSVLWFLIRARERSRDAGRTDLGGGRG